MKYNIKHNPQWPLQKVIDYFSEREASEGYKRKPLKYVCSTELNVDNVVIDVYYSDEQHPEYGNNYVGVYKSPTLNHTMVTNADTIEDYDFDMILVKDQYHYSQCRWDYNAIGDIAIDGGRQYTRIVGNLSGVSATTFKVKDGEFCLKV